jgi:hypothetical protein
VHLGLETHGDSAALLALVGDEEHYDEQSGSGYEDGLGNHEGANTGQVAGCVFAFEEEGTGELACGCGTWPSATAITLGRHIKREDKDVQFIKDNMVDFLVVPPTFAIAHE